MVTEICVSNYVGDIYQRAKFYPNRFLRKATGETRAPILTQNTSIDAVPRKEVSFGGRETKT